jgi:hypothetical protein
MIIFRPGTVPFCIQFFHPAYFLCLLRLSQEKFRLKSRLIGADIIHEEDRAHADPKVVPRCYGLIVDVPSLVEEFA